MTDQKLHFGIKTTQYSSYEEILHVWQEADSITSIEQAWLFDHPMPIGRADPSGPCLDGWTLLAALAAQTKRLRLGLQVASNVNQTPPWLAKRAATVDIISGGRLEFGLGAGGLEREHSVYLIIDAQENLATTRQIVQSFIEAGATQIVLASRTPVGGVSIARWLSEEIIEPVRAAVGA